MTPLRIRREAYEALPLLKRALIELKIQQGEIAIIEDASPAQAQEPAPQRTTTRSRVH